VAVEAALAYAMVGDSAEAESLAAEIRKLHPLDTQSQSLWLPAIQAQLALNKHDPDTALAALQPALPPIEYGAIAFLANLSPVYTAYLREEAKLAQRGGADADAARVRALAAYQDFLALWKDADPQIPIYRQAKTEYARLQ
jgi:eukaryotic-like serine/threonine-protein kinase